MLLRAIAEDPNAATVDHADATVDQGSSYGGFQYDSAPDASSFQDAASVLNPNVLMERGKRPQSIIYTGRLYVDPDVSGRAHASFYLRGKNRGLQADLGRFLTVDPTKDTQAWRQQWRQLYSRFLFGRMAWFQDRQVVSFWGQGSADGTRDIKSPTHLIRPCLYALDSEGYLSDDTTVVLGDGSVGRVDEIIMGGGPSRQGDEESARRTELAKRMHLATGGEKKEIMRRLGVGGGGSDKTDKWDAALRRSGGLAPGQNKWRMTSESFADRLGRALGVDTRS